jgi:hypothetical protein
MKMEERAYSETSAYKIQTPGNHPEENIQCTATLTCFVLNCSEPGPVSYWHTSMYRFNYESNQQDATIQVNLLFLVSSTCFGRCFRPSSEALDCIYSIWSYSPKLLPAGVLDELKHRKQPYWALHTYCGKC